MRLAVLAAIREVSESAWDALVGEGSPFLEWRWLSALEDSGAAAPETGWVPQHVTLWEGDRLVGGCPLYLKAHSLGEFVFDRGWAVAAERAGIPYYPKLLVAVPFTPVTGARFLTAPGVERPAVIAALVDALERLCVARDCSSVHVNFCLPDEVEALTRRGWLRRTDCQYHWTGDGFATFDDYLASLRSKRRNQVKRERRGLEEAGVEITSYAGDAVPDAVFSHLYQLYRVTIDRLPWGQLYLNPAFFTLARERLRDRLCIIAAHRRGELIAATFNLQKGDTFYGRYWGTLREVRHLHFNVCYYAAIEYCVTHGLRRFEPGAGGEFKLLRGFDAVQTQSMHYVREPRLAAAIRRFLADERRAMANEMQLLRAHTARRRDE